MHTFIRTLVYLLLTIGFYLSHYQSLATPTKSYGTLSWRGGAINDEQNWFNPDNWEPTMVPDEYQDVVLDEKSLHNCVIAFGEAKCHSLILNARAILLDSMQDSLQVFGNILFGGGVMSMQKGGKLMLYKDWIDNSAGESFVAGQGEVIWKGSSLQNIVSNKTQYYYSFVMAGANVELKTAIEINGKLSLKKGILTTLFKNSKNYLLTLNFTASLGEIGQEGTGGNSQSFVHGPMQWKVQDTNLHYFPVGLGIYYAPIAVTPKDNSPKIYRAEYYPKGFDLYNIETADTIFMSRICSNEYWTLLTFPVTGGTILNDDAKVRLHWRYKTGLPFVGNRKDIYVARYASDSWNMEGFSPFVEDKGTQWGVVESDIFIKSFGSFTFGSKSGLIPVNFINFEGSVTETFGVELKWEMGEYGKTKQFQLERSIDETSFTTIGILDSSSLTNLHNVYSFIDRFPIEGYNYYRIKQIDKNGANNYSQTIVIYLELGGFPKISALYPNPVQNVLNINMEYYVPEDGNVKAEIYDSHCTLIAMSEETSKGGNKTMSLDISGFPSGIYLCVLRFRGAMEGIKFLKI